MSKGRIEDENVLNAQYPLAPRLNTYRRTVLGHYAGQRDRPRRATHTAVAVSGYSSVPY